MRIAIVKRPGLDTAAYEALLKKRFTLDKKRPDLVFVFGGDGSLLSSERAYPGVPKLGFSKGRVAFLMQQECGKLKAVLDRIEKGAFEVEQRLALQCEAGRAVNEIAVLSPRQGRMIEPVLHIGKQRIPVRGDGLIISTPTGSTGYCLAAGGPVLPPGIDALCIVPLASQKRLPSLVLSGNETVKITGDLLVVIDGLSETRATALTIRQSDTPMRIVKLEDDFYTRLFGKLSAGVI